MLVQLPLPCACFHSLVAACAQLVCTCMCNGPQGMRMRSSRPCSNVMQQGFQTCPYMFGRMCPCVHAAYPDNSLPSSLLLPRIHIRCCILPPWLPSCPSYYRTTFRLLIAHALFVCICVTAEGLTSHAPSLDGTEWVHIREYFKCMIQAACCTAPAVQPGHPF